MPQPDDSFGWHWGDWQEKRGREWMNKHLECPAAAPLLKPASFSGLALAQEETWTHERERLRRYATI